MSTTYKTYPVFELPVCKKTAFMLAAAEILLIESIERTDSSITYYLEGSKLIKTTLLGKAIRAISL